MMYPPNCYCFSKSCCANTNLTVSSVFTISSFSYQRQCSHIASEASPLTAQVRLVAKTRQLATPRAFYLGMLRSTRRRLHSPMCLLPEHSRRNLTICCLDSSMWREGNARQGTRRTRICLSISRHEEITLETAIPSKLQEVQRT